MNICHITTVHTLNDTRIYLKEIFSLTDVGYKIDFIVKKNEIKYQNDNVNFHFLDNKPGLLNRVKNIFAAFKKGLEFKADIYHFHDPELIPVGVLLKLFTKGKVIYDIHEIYKDAILYKPYLNKFLAKIFSIGYDIIEKISIPFFDLLVLAEDAYKKYYQGKKYIIVQNFLPEKYIVFKNPESNNEEINLVYLGGISKVRGIYEMLNFVNEIKNDLNFKLHLIGNFSPEILEIEVKTIIKDKKLEKFVKIYGRIDLPDALKIVRNSDIGLIFVKPILNNLTILPTKMFEYMGNGLAVIMRDMPLLVDFNERHKIGLTLDVNNITNEKEKILNFVKDLKTLKKIKMNNINTVSDNYTWEIEFKKLMFEYTKLLL